ncbi:sigma-70 family RNA polymerase sigma factor [Macrococcoides goetzii]|nr:sigma-70 family RNA polymerase sigma factor [Macrococcus goetzii]TDM45680.1 sigma-70 family RNA polymerase sigma factor [Macrococcus goetzii]
MEFKDVYQKYNKLIFSIAYHMTGNLNDAEDITQETFEKFYSIENKELQFKKAYLCRIAKNLCINKINKSAKIRVEYAGVNLPEPLGDKQFENKLEESFIHNETFNYNLLYMLGTLNEDERLLFILREGLNFPYDEIATILDKKVSTLRKIHRRSKAKLLNDDYSKCSNTFKQMDCLVNAIQEENIPKILELLSNETVVISDGGNKMNVSKVPITKLSRVAALFKVFINLLNTDKNYHDISYEIYNHQMALNFGINKELSMILGVGNDSKINRIYFIFN